MQQNWTFEFLKVARQYILGVVDNVAIVLLENLIGFPAVKELWI